MSNLWILNLSDAASGYALRTNISYSVYTLLQRYYNINIQCANMNFGKWLG